MKIKKIVDICQKRGVLYLYNNGGEQWLSDGMALYPLYGAPAFSTEALATAYDIQDKTVDKMAMRYFVELPTAFDFGDVADGEHEASRWKFSINYNGQQLIPYALNDNRGVAFVNAKYLEPITDRDRPVLFERYTEAGQLYFAAKEGLLLTAIILPEDIICKDFVDSVGWLAERCSQTLDERMIHQTKEGDAPDGQMRMG